jgi:glucose/arabinose dehydrogenase
LKYLFTFIISIFVLTGCQNETEVREDNETSREEVSNTTKNEENRTESKFINMSTEDWDVEVLADNLHYPWDIKVLDDFIVMPEVVGTIAVLEDGQLKRYNLQTSDPIVQEGGSGLLGIALADDFLESGIAYLYHTYRTESGLSNKVIQVLYDGESWKETNVLLDGIPGHELYNGGRIAIGPDAKLYVATGWAHEEEFAQDIDNLGGKIFRMNLDGSIPEDNPFPDSYVYSYGHRNPQGLAWNSDGTIMYSSEHGESAHDEINIIEPGKNYGWPVITGDEEREGMEKALLHSGNDTWAPSGVTFFEDHLFIAGLKGQSLYVYNEAASSLDVIFTSNERLRNVYPFEGDLYVITTNTSPRAGNPGEDDRLLKLSPRK